MFAQFSKLMFKHAASSEYNLVAAGSENIQDSQIWVAEKLEMATLVCLNVVNFSQMNLQTLIENDKKVRERAEAILNRVSNVANIYILAGGDAADFNFDFEEYLGQPVYSIFWHVNLQTGEISVPKGQPKKFFNIREMVLSSLKEMHKENTEGNFSESFSEISSRAAKLRLKEKHRHPIFSYAVIFLNFVILGLMYLYGYHAEDLLVPLRFGAIVPGLIVYNGEWYRLFSAMFLHFGVAHCFANAFGILIFGTRLEKYLGRKIFFATYILAGLLGSVFSLVNLYFFHPHVISAGASGAVYGLVGTIFAYTRITKRSIEFINWYFMLIYIGLGMAMGFGTTGIDNFAHIGGLFGGIIIGGAYALKKRKGESV